MRLALRRSDSFLSWDGDAQPRREPADNWRFEEAAGASGAFRYRAKVESPRHAPEGQRLAALKQLYRRLARRFHPDLALDETDRAYRTDLMMAINAAYTAGNLEELERLAQEPDSISRAPQSIEELAADLEREVERGRRRLVESATELAPLEEHDCALLLRRAERAMA